MKIKYLGYILLMLLMGCEQPQQTEPPPRPALVMVVGVQAAASNMSLVGEVRPRYESSQGFRIDGKIIERKVDVGAMVRKGQLIARLDPADTDLNVSAAQADVRAAEASRTLAAAELARYRQLFAKKFVSASALDIKAAELKTANAKLAQAKAQAHVSVNRTQYTHLTADRDGVVTMIRAEPGQVVTAGGVVVQIADTNAIEVLAAVPESHMAEVQLNATVAVRLWSAPQKTYSGLIREISPSAESATRAFNVRIAIQDADSAVKLGMTARIKFNPQDVMEDAGFLIPSTALTEVNGKKMVWIIDTNNKAQPREVVAGQFGELGILIASGLQAGEKIAIAGVHTLIKGQPVKPVVEAAP
ncbi:efflux RND transporter periplasmic adaptor subunit [Methyloglobulus sp.]|uniref:efflux RND transporter periplasmic adaptor subunit n=1 Tax=Methyloglobulus sp. TaxID=2518622 RepID=UPI0032B8666F